MLLKLILIHLLTKAINSYTIEMVVYPKKKTCVIDLFPENSPISVQAVLKQSSNQNYQDFYLTLEDELNQLLSHRKYELNQENFILTYNNPVA